MIKIKSTALLFAIIILSTGSVFAQTSNSKPEDFKSFSKKFFKDKKFQLERIVFPVTLYKCERTTTEQGKNTHSDTFDQFSKMNKKLSSYLEMDNVDEDAVSVEKEGDTVVYWLSQGPCSFEFRFILKDNKYYLFAMKSSCSLS